MRIARTSQISFDPQLAGTWTSQNGSIRFSDDGFLYDLFNYEFSISTDDSTLTIGTEVSGLTYGDGQSIVGVWSRRTNVDGLLNVLDTFWRNTNTYTTHWLIDGKLQQIGTGYYEVQGSALMVESRRGLASTTSANKIFIDGAYVPRQSGDYAFPAQNVLVLTLEGIESTYQRVT